MKWLVTFKQVTPPYEIDEILGRVGCSPPDAQPIPLGDDEVVIRIDGPLDLPQRLRHEPSVVKVSPDSTQSFF